MSGVKYIGPINKIMSKGQAGGRIGTHNKV